MLHCVNGTLEENNTSKQEHFISQSTAAVDLQLLIKCCVFSISLTLIPNHPQVQCFTFRLSEDH